MLPLTSYSRHSGFITFLMVRRTKGAEVKDTYLQQVRWSTKVALEPKAEDHWRPAKYSAAGYKTLDRTIETSWADGVVTAYFHALPPVSAKTANGNHQASWLSLAGGW
jgi:hypothetical protein